MRKLLLQIIALIITMGMLLETNVLSPVVQAKEIETSCTTVDTFSYEYSGKAKSLISLYEKALNNQDDLYYIEPEKSGSDGTIYRYKQSTESTRYLYYGSLKKGRPNGKGIVFKDNKVAYIGNFKNGYPSGYGISYTDYVYNYYIEYEGEWSKGKYDGDGIIYAYLSVDATENQSSTDEAPFSREVFDVVLNPVFIAYEGQFKAGEYSGTGTSYVVEGETLQRYVWYTGSYKKGERSGTGTVYYLFSEDVLYKGEFKNGEYNGKGTLYYQDGSVEYKGQFKNGEVK